jgi:hypothetical protein
MPSPRVISEFTPKLAHERGVGTATEYGVGVDESEHTEWAHGDGDVTVTSAAALLFGFTVTSAITGDFALRDGTSASGALVYAAAATLAIGTTVLLPGIKCDDGIFVDDNATGGTISIFWRAQ